MLASTYISKISCSSNYHFISFYIFIIIHDKSAHARAEKYMYTSNRLEKKLFYFAHRPGFGVGNDSHTTALKSVRERSCLFCSNFCNHKYEFEYR